MVQGTETGQVLPDLTLPGPAGPVRLRAFRGRRNLVVAFVCDEAPDRARLRDLAALDLALYEATLVAIAPVTPGRAADLARETDALVLADQARETARHFLGGTVRALFVTDRWGEVWAWWRGDDLGALPSAAAVRDWLHLIEIQCPECSHA